MIYGARGVFKQKLTLLILFKLTSLYELYFMTLDSMVLRLRKLYKIYSKLLKVVFYS